MYYLSICGEKKSEEFLRVELGEDYLVATFCPTLTYNGKDYEKILGYTEDDNLAAIIIVNDKSKGLSNKFNYIIYNEEGVVMSVMFGKFKVDPEDAIAYFINNYDLVD